MQAQTLSRTARVASFIVLAFSVATVLWSYVDAWRVGTWPRLQPWPQLALLAPAISNVLIPASRRRLCILKLVLCVSTLIAAVGMFFPGLVPDLVVR